MAELYSAFLLRDGINSTVVNSGEAAIAKLRSAPPAVVVLDLNLPGMSGFEVLRRVVNDFPTTAVIIVTSQGSVRTAVDAMQEGAYDFLMKPFNADRLVTTVRNALERARLRDEVVTLREGLGREQFCGFIGASLPMQAVYRMIEAAAPSNVTVFITGESGTGKEVAAEAIHRLSSRKDKPFVALNCGAISRELAESELFGHFKGSFTGAIADRPGAVQQAAGGTLFLDELCEMPLDLQIKLLRFLQSGSFRPVGATRTEKADVRIVCATNRDPLQEIRMGRFREDLYYRLHVIPIAMPPLREREDDALLIAEELLEKFAKEDRRPVKHLSADTRGAIRTYDWPGNIRQLQNVIRNAIVLNAGDVLSPDMLNLPTNLRPVTEPQTDHQVLVQDVSGTAAAVLKPLVQEMAAADKRSSANPEDWHRQSDILGLETIEQAAILKAINLCDGNIPKAAALLGVNPSTIYRKKQAWEAA